MEEISATLGIDINAATPEQVAKRAYEFALEWPIVMRSAIWNTPHLWPFPLPSNQ